MILQVQHVKKFFGKRLILDDINFSIDAGEIFGIVGLSGGGKSTLARASKFLTHHRQFTREN